MTDQQLVAHRTSVNRTIVDSEHLNRADALLALRLIESEIRRCTEDVAAGAIAED